MNNILSLSGKITLVTGAGQGVGQHIAIRFAEHQARVVIVNDYNLNKANETVNLIQKLNNGVKAVAIKADVTKWQEVNSMVQSVIKKFGSIDVLVNNAGNAGASTEEEMQKLQKFSETDPEEWHKWIEVNYYGPMYTCRAALPYMIENNYGKIVNVISDAGRVGEPRLVIYSGAKAGTAGFTRGLAKEVGKNNITANCVALSSIKTKGVSSLLEDEAVVNKMLKNYPIKRLGEPADAANAVLFLSSGASSWVTGQTYPVNGGYSLNQ